MTKVSKRGWALFLGMLAAILLLSVYLGLRQFALTIDDVTEMRRADILKQTKVELDLTIDLSAIPDDLDMRNHHQNLAIPVYQTETTTIYLRSLDENGDGWLRLLFDCEYGDLPERGKVLLPYDVLIDGKAAAHTGEIDENRVTYCSPIRVDETVRDETTIFEEGAFMWASGSSEQFGCYLDSAILEEAQGTITVYWHDLNQLEYAKR